MFGRAITTLGIGLAHILVDINEQLAKHAEERKFCFAVEDSKAEKLSASG